MSKPPIIPLNYIHGVKVVDIGDLRIARGKTRRERTSCKHLNLTYDDNERRVVCDDCETELDPFDAFKALVEHIDGATKRLQHREDQIKKAESFAIRSVAAKHVDKVWRSRTRVPLCPHCKQALMPDDFKHGCATTGAQIERTRRSKKQAQEAE